MSQIILNIKYIAVFSALSLFALFLSVRPIFAQEMVISGNGSGADSQVLITSDSQTTVEQSNQANITNDVNVAADTGNNSASSNTATDTSINTGNINSDTSIQNSVNTSVVSLDCCPNQSDLNVNISDNGTNSQNLVDLNLSNNTSIDVNQYAYINNTVNGDANTGLNSANDNSGGDVSIKTGNINVSDDIRNHQINNTYVSAGAGGTDLNVKISGNGSDSNNLVALSLSNNLLINVQNISDILNSSNWFLNTGGNSANGNSGGSVAIITGDINVNTKITNDGINSNEVIVACCDTIFDPGDDPFDPADPGDDPAGGPISSLPSSSTSKSDQTQSSAPGSNSSSPGQVLAQAIGAAGQILPATGSLWTILLTLAALIMFMSGLYLRQHPGRDPSLRYVYV